MKRDHANDSFWFAYVSTWIYKGPCKSIKEAEEQADNDWGCYLMGGEL